MYFLLIETVCNFVQFQTKTYLHTQNILSQTVLIKNNMKKLFYAILALVFVNAGVSAQGVKTPAPSPTQTIKQVVWFLVI
jgi:hypothetical protein